MKIFQQINFDLQAGIWLNSITGINFYIHHTGKSSFFIQKLACEA